MVAKSELSSPVGCCPGVLIARCQGGDREAFTTLVASYHDIVYAMAFHVLGDETLAADATQEVFLKVLSRIQQFRGEAEFTTWLYRIVVNTCLTQLKRAQRFIALDHLPHVISTFVGEAPQETVIARREAVSELRKALLTLGPAFRLPLVLRYVVGLSYEEIGQVLDLPGGTVASRLKRGHRALKKKLLHLSGPGRKVVTW